MVYWPIFKSTKRVKRAAANEEKHEPDWPRYDVKVVRTCDNYKDAIRLMNQYQTGCKTSELQSEAEQEGELPEKRVRKPIHRFGDSDESEEEPENCNLASLRSPRPSNSAGVSVGASSPNQLHWQTPPSHRVPGSRVTTPQPGGNCLSKGDLSRLIVFQWQSIHGVEIGSSYQNVETYKFKFPMTRDFLFGPVARSIPLVNRSQPFNSNFSPLAPDNGARPQHPSPPQLPAPAFNMRRVTQGTAVPPHLPPPPAPSLNMRRTEEPSSSLAYRPTWRGGEMTNTIPYSGEH
ncbi:uncharacterized protein LOC114839555 isoform X1 [Esox lucius]|uniref:uncharacterized protein LOC114839555 isoform X1 n=1 Tax=Esox lucius TaxID=8010 RepID=UPI0014773CAA|nr:uncharacterized protein LOC114839555 isoform X1 [Esox lucius]XP_034149393.1 uncharacterized protein LOC114839555 isoform X1 [Esox lucius]